MSSFLQKLVFLSVVFVIFSCALAAQSITLTPTMQSVGMGKTIQFTATVSGLSSTDVIWYAGSVAGGNSTSGTISSTGLYTAPAKIPGQNPVQIRAVSADTRVSATTYVIILTDGPVITSVSPNPLPAGTFTVTIQGTGIQPYATVLNGTVQLVTLGTTSTSVTATGWQGPASSATFVVTNPGSTPSNPLTIPVTAAPATTYSLTVVNGSGSGSYAAGSVVTIKANSPPSGQSFSNWSGAAVANASASTTTLTMPAANVKVTANYTAATAGYTLTVVNGYGSGSYAAGTPVSITANKAPAGQTFSSWTGATVANASAASTTLTMPAANVTVTANYTSPTVTYTLTVVNGSGSGSYPAGTPVTITANKAPAGQTFSSWTGATVANAGASSTTLTMPAANVTVTANYTSPTVTYTLTVVNGSGSGSYAAGTPVAITANPAPSGQTFYGWGGATVASATSPTTTLTMPASNVTVTAYYTSPKYTLTVVNGTGSGTYATGTSVSITANTPQAGQSFSGWTGATVTNASAASTTLTMPAANVTVTANYTSPTVTYTLTVVNGSGSGSYAAGTPVTITANAPPTGQSFANWSGATVANATASTTTLTMPASNATVTANYTAATYTLTVVNGSGSGSFAANTVVTITANAPPSGQLFSSWTGASVANANAPSTTLTMPASNTTVTANFAVPSTIPYPISSHPRLWVTPNDLPRLQSWAAKSNPVYQQGLLPVLQTAVNLYNTQFFPGGQPNPNYPDPGDTQGYTGYLTEEYGAILAFNSLIDPNPANRILYAQYARNMLMYAMNQASLGTLSGAPFRDRLFATYNRASESGEEWALIVDWIYNAVDAGGNPILTAADKATIRNVFMMWAAACETASTTGGDSPAPVGIMNSFQLLPNNKPYRFAANNYYTAHARLMTMMALAVDPSDDPPVNAAQAPSVLGNSLRSYLSDALGAWLYQQYAMYADGPTVAGAYGIPGSGAGFGLASGGLPPEGMLYGVSYGNLLQGLLSLQTAGFNNPAYLSYTGPQIGMISVPMWDRYVKGMISSLIPAPITPTAPGESYLGQVYQFASYGDLLRLYVTPDYMMPFTLLALLEQQNGQSTHLADARWFNYQVAQGGPNAFYRRMTDPYTFADTILHYLLYDPAVSPASAPDPRPGYPTIFVDPGGGRIVAHSDWSAGSTMFDYHATWLSINHQDATTGQFELYRNGEWLTKELSNYDNNGLGMTTYYHNTLGLQNTCSACTPSAVINWWETGELANGSQWMIGMNAGDPVTKMSNGPGYVYAATDMTNLYNRPNVWTPGNSFNNITQATRSILWYNNDYIVVYDRATSINTGLFKRWNLTLVNNPIINGKAATETLASGQQLFVQSLLPANSTIAARNVLGDLTTVAELEPSQYVMTIQDPSNPSDTRFLHVLQGANAGAAMVPAAYQQSTAGTPFDGAVFGSTAVYFPVSGNGSFAGTSLPAPAGVHTMLVSGLTPNAGYSVTIQAAGAGSAIGIAPGGSGVTADAAGLLRLTF